MSGIIAVSTKTCLHCGHAGAVMLPQAGIIAYRNGALVQNAFPEVPKEEREQFLTGIHPACFTELFPSDDIEEQR